MKTRDPSLKPSKKHYLQYDAATFEHEGFKTLNGRVSQLALEPRFWSVSVVIKTENYDGTGKIKDHFSFPSKKRCKLEGLREEIKEEIYKKKDYAPVCTQCLVTARVMM